VARTQIGCAVGPDLDEWLKMLSTRDAGSIERLYHWPLPAAGGHAGLLICTEIDKGLEGDHGFREHLPEVLGTVGQVLEDRREHEMRRLRNGASGAITATPEQVIADALNVAGATGGFTVLVRVAVGPLLDAVTAAAPGLDRFRLMEDIAQALARLARDVATAVIGPSPDDLYLLFRGVARRDGDLWVHSLLQALGPLVPSVRRFPALTVRSAQCPEDGQTARDLLSAVR
jgi:hypothetical protein